MIELVYLSCVGFKSFINQEQIDLSRYQTGLLLISGKNLVDDSLEGNGAGKSTLCDAICWCLYGKTVRGVKAGNVVAWGREQKPGCSVSLCLSCDGEEFVVVRTQSPNTLKINGKEATEEMVQDLVGMNHVCFLHTVMMGQFNPFFFDLSATEKLQLFSDILDLSVWYQCSNAAKRKVTRCIDQYQKIQSQIARYEGIEQEAQKSLEELKRKAASYREDQEKEALRLKDAIVLVNEEYTEAVKQKQQWLEKETTLKDKQLALSKKVDDLQKQRQEYQVTFSGQHVVFKHLQEEVKKLQNEKTKVQVATEDGVCPYCKQSVSSSYSSKLLASICQKIDDLTAEIEQKENSLDKINQNIKALSSVLCSVSQKEQGISQELDEARDYLESFSMKISRLSVQSSGLDASLKRAKLPDPYQSQIKSIQKRLEEVKVLKRGEERNARQNEVLRASAEFWVTEFKNLRLWLIDTTLRELEMEVNNHLETLGLVGWGVRFDVERELKSGAVSKGFSVFVKAPFVDGEVPWESWSGGETQRLRLASQMGLSSLIQNRKAERMRFEFWDEPTAHLSGEGINDLLETLRMRAEESRRQIWIVDHRSLSSGEFDGELRIVKTKEKGSLVQYV